MKKIVLTFGLIAGGIVGVMTSIMVPLLMSGRFDFSGSELVGYSTMVLAFLAVFFGIRRYRDTLSGGAITFGRAFKVGILITLVACAVYVIAWEIVYWGFLPDFEEQYAAMSTEKLRASGATEAEVAAHEQQMARFQELYRNPLFNVGMTFMEIFPVGLIMTLVSAAILRRRAAAGGGAAAPGKA